MADLRAIMSSVSADDAKLRRDPAAQRRFIIAEGLYRSTGNIVPLPELMALKEQFCYRLILDESLSFGCVGKTGKGVTELFDIPTTDVDMLILSMGTTLASVGGVSIGTRAVVDHQRLSGPGYCFSASAPPLFSAVALANLSVLQDSVVREKLFSSLQRNIVSMHETLASINVFSLVTDAPSETSYSPVIHVALNESNPVVASRLSAIDTSSDWDRHEVILSGIVSECLVQGAGVTMNIAQSQWIDEYEKSRSLLRPTLRVCVSAKLLLKDIKQAGKVLKAAADKVFESRARTGKSPAAKR